MKTKPIAPAPLRAPKASTPKATSAKGRSHTAGRFSLDVDGYSPGYLKKAKAAAPKGTTKGFDVEIEGVTVGGITRSAKK